MTLLAIIILVLWLADRRRLRDWYQFTIDDDRRWHARLISRLYENSGIIRELIANKR